MNFENKISRRDLLKAGAACAAGAAIQGMFGSNTLLAAGGPGSPNILLLTIDQLSWNAIANNGCTFVKTPNIDKIFQKGISFNKSYSSCPLCAPARTTWYTGREAKEHLVVDNNTDIDPGITDMGRVFSDPVTGKYEAALFGKWHVPGRLPEGSFPITHQGTGIGEGEHRDSVIARLASGFLASRTSQAPFLAVVNLVNPHDTCQWKNGLATELPAPFPIAEIAASLPPLPGNFYDVPNPEPGLVANKFRGAQEPNWSPTWWQYYIWGYHRYIEMVDSEVGLIMNTLARSPYADNTLVVFTSDHGEGQGCHKTTGKIFLYDEAARVPLVFSGKISGVPISTTAVTNNTLVASVDILPTVCAYANITPPEKMRGRNLKPVLDGGSITRDYIRAESDKKGRMIRSAQYKYIKYNDDGVEQLFDMQNDPLEKINRADDGGAWGPVLQLHRDYLTAYEATLKDT